MADWVTQEGADDDRSDGSNGGEIELAPIGPVVRYEAAQGAIAAASKAAISARYELAMQRPRNIDNVRVKLLKECDRPGFAKEARYRKPVGKERDPVTGEWVEKHVEGLSIRFAEAARRHMGNCYDEATAIYDDEDKVIFRITVMDLETNATTSTDVTIAKTVERRKLRRGQRAIATRTNSYGDQVFLVRASDEQMRSKIKGEIAKELRDGLLGIVPGDILDECEARCIEVAKKEDAKDPDRARKDVIDAFAKLGVSPDELGAYVGHDLGVLSPTELTNLRAIYAALRSGETSWAELRDGRESKDGDEPAKNDTTAKKVDDLIAKHKSKKPAKTEEAKASPVPASSAPTESKPTHDPSTGEVRAEDEPPQQSLPTRQREPGVD